MKVAVFSTAPYERSWLEEANRARGHEVDFFEHRLDASTAALAPGYGAVCVFCNDDLSAPTIAVLAEAGVRLLALRSAGFNHVDLGAAERHGLTVLRVPAYSPHAVAEHAVGLILTLNRKIHRAHARVREGNFSLAGLVGFDLHGKTVGVVGTGRIGTVACRILAGFGCEVLAHDPYPNDACRAMGVSYEPLEALLERAHVLTLHCPLTPTTHHMIDRDALARAREGLMLVNTSRGGLVDTRAVIESLKSGRLGSLAIDVYEEEADLFFRDLSEQVLQDDVFARLLTFPNVLVTAHQAFLTREALGNIADTTIRNVSEFEAGRPDPENVVDLSLLKP